MLRSLALASAVVAATGCQTFVGIEDVDDILADLEQALAAVK